MKIKKWKGRINLNTQKSELKDKGAIDMGSMIKLNSYKLKELSQKTKNRREKMKNYVFTGKDTYANENFKDLEEEVYSNIK